MIKVHLQLNCVFENELGQRIDPQLSALLQAIHRCGTLSAAAEEIGLSYRHAWGLIHKWSGFFGHSLVELERAKGARLSPLGKKLLWAQQRVNARLTPQLESLASEMEGMLNEITTTGQPLLRLHASHDLALIRLRDSLDKEHGLRLDVQFRGSLESLVSLCKARCDMAGFHIPEGKIGERIANPYRCYLKPRSQKLVKFVRRQQGLMVAHGNPKQIRNLSDISTAGACFINRQLGSGTRLILDSMLERQGIASAQIDGYNSEEFTHFAVAATVASGAADVGFGVEAAARQFNLGFIPLVMENYYLIARQEFFEQPLAKKLLSILGSQEFKRRVTTLPGYDATHSGTMMSLREAIPGFD